MAVFIFFGMTFFCDPSFAETNNPNANRMSYGKPVGVVYFSNGSDLIKYDFSSKKKEVLFRFHEESELGKKITQLTYSAYLRGKRKILFIGLKNLSERHIFESDLNLRNWKEYATTENIGDMSLSPDEKVIAFYRHPNKAIIKKYADLEKEGCERIVATDASARPIWVSNSELVYYSKAKNIVKLDVDSGVQLTLAKDVFPESVSPDGKYMLCSKKDSIYLYDVSHLQLRLLKKGGGLYNSSPDIWSWGGRYFLYSKYQKVKLTFNLFKYMNDLIAERQDVWVHCIATGADEKILENEKAPFGGFWLEGRD